MVKDSLHADLAINASTVASRTGLRRLNGPSLFEFSAESDLGGACFWISFPIEIIDLFKRAYVILWCAMTFKTPAHALGFAVVNDLHILDFTMATVATYSTTDVNGMIEVDVIGRFVNAHPRN